jgi:hypothetical protein
MQSYPKDVEAVTSAATAILLLAGSAGEPDARKAARCDTLMVCGAGFGLARVLQSYRQHVGLARVAAMGVCQLAGGTRSDELMASGAGGELVRVLQTHGDRDHDLADSVLRALLLLAAESPSRKAQLEKLGAQDAVAEALRTVSDWAFGGWDKW